MTKREAYKRLETIEGKRHRKYIRTHLQIMCDRYKGAQLEKNLEILFKNVDSITPNKTDNERLFKET